MIPEKFLELLQTPLGVFELITLLIVGLCILVIIISVIINFAESNRKAKTKDEKKSIVETGTMFLFFLFYYFLLRQGIGMIRMDNLTLKIVLTVFGLLLLIIGCITNVMGRFALGKNWANQIKIYKDQTLVKTGVYSIVRHPLYASLIWMFYGGSLVFMNYAGFLANTFIFIPFMYYRAKQEEKLLSKTFKDYEKYKKEVGMFFPRW